MRYILPLLWILLKPLTAAAQDTIRVTYSEESDTLTVHQKFIDRYDNVFMTRVPTKHIVKAGYRTSDLRGIGIGVDISYEYKLLPALSLEATLRGQTNTPNDAILIARLSNHGAVTHGWVQKPGGTTPCPVEFEKGSMPTISAGLTWQCLTNNR